MGAGWNAFCGQDQKEPQLASDIKIDCSTQNSKLIISESDQKAAEIFSMAGDQLTYEERYTQAINCYKMAIKRNPEFAKAYNDLGWVYQKINKINQAIACYQRAVELNHKHPSAFLNLQGILLNQGTDQHVKRSREILDEILKVNSETSLAAKVAMESVQSKLKSTRNSYD